MSNIAPVLEADLPQPGAEYEGGTFAGTFMRPDKSRYGVVLLPDHSPRSMTWADAAAWASSVGGELPPLRAVDALLHESVRSNDQEWHWLGEPAAAGQAWIAYLPFGSRAQADAGKTFGAVAVRIVPIREPDPEPEHGTLMALQAEESHGNA